MKKILPLPAAVSWKDYHREYPENPSHRKHLWYSRKEVFLSATPDYVKKRPQIKWRRWVHRPECVCLLIQKLRVE